MIFYETEETRATQGTVTTFRDEKCMPRRFVALWARKEKTAASLEGGKKSTGKA
jgi:hypothetical protein